MSLPPTSLASPKQLQDEPTFNVPEAKGSPPEVMGKGSMSQPSAAPLSLALWKSLKDHRSDGEHKAAARRRGVTPWTLSMA